MIHHRFARGSLSLLILAMLLPLGACARRPQRYMKPYGEATPFLTLHLRNRSGGVVDAAGTADAQPVTPVVALANGSHEDMTGQVNRAHVLSVTFTITINGQQPAHRVLDYDAGNDSSLDGGFVVLDGPGANQCHATLSLVNQQGQPLPSVTVDF